MSLAKTIEARGRVVGEGREPLICVPLLGRSRTAILDDLEDLIVKGPDLIEWRVDYFEGAGDTSAVIDVARAVRRGAGEIPVIFTLRSAREGGQPVDLGDEDAALLFVAACAARVADFIDVEMSAPGEHVARVRAACRDSGTRLILSFHDFHGTPDADQLLGRFRRAEELGGDVAKVAVMPRGPDDVLTLLAATLRASRELAIPLISISMGPIGVLSRTFGWMFGSTVTFAAGQDSSAPGQLPIDDLKAVLALLRTPGIGA